MRAPRSLMGPETKAADRGTLAFRKNSKSPLLTPEQLQRQGDVVRSARRHFGENGPLIAFLNTRHYGLESQPLHLAIESDEGLERVETFLKQIGLEA